MLLLFAATALVILLPLLPALAEWRRPTDVSPLPIDQRDALEPDWLARRFVAAFEAARAAGERRFEGRDLAAIEVPWVVPLSPLERGQRNTRRLWHARGDAMLPAGQHFFGEVVAGGHLHAGANGQYHALWAGERLMLGPQAALTGWGHGRAVVAGEGCRLRGRVSADTTITLEGEAAFTLLHAPAVLFSPGLAGPAPRRHAIRAQRRPLPASLAWEPLAARGTCRGALTLDPGLKWTGDIVTHGDLRLGSGCIAEGSLKSHQGAALGWACHVQGSLFAAGRVELGDGCRVEGALVSETEIVLGEGCTVGAPDRPATVAAPRITVGAGCVVHGTLWAGEYGLARAAAAQPRTPLPQPAHAR